MPNLSAQDFELWLRPRDALARLGHGDDAVLKTAIAARIRDGRIRLAAQSLKGAGRAAQTPERVLIDPAYLHQPWAAHWDDFWHLGQVLFVRDVTGFGGFAQIRIVGVTDAFDPQERHLFLGVRLDPDALAREFNLDLSRVAAGLDKDTQPLPPPNLGGRPSGKHGAPIANVTKRLLQVPVEVLRDYTADALSIELQEEYRKFGLRPSIDVNARKDAAGILSVVRE